MTIVKKHLRRNRHGKSIVRKHRRRLTAGKASLNPFFKKKIGEKSIHEVTTNNLLESARNLYDRGEISLEQMAEIERRARLAPLEKKEDSEDLYSSRSKYVLTYGPNGRPSGVRKISK